MVCVPVLRDNPPSYSEGIIECTGAQTMFYITYTMISSVDLAHYGVSCAKDWVSVDSGTNLDIGTVSPMHSAYLSLYLQLGIAFLAFSQLGRVMQ